MRSAQHKAPNCKERGPKETTASTRVYHVRADTRQSVASLDGSWERAHRAALRMTADDRERVVSIDLGVTNKLE